MKSRFVLSLFAAAAAVCMLGFSAGSALASHSYTASVSVPAGLTPDDLHITFTGTGGTITNPSATPDAGDGNPNVAGVTGGNTVDVEWDNKLAPLDPVTVTFHCDHANLAVDSGTWTNGGSVIGAVAPGSVTLVEQVPGASPLVMLLIAMAIAGGGIMMLRRRAEA